MPRMGDLAATDVYNAFDVPGEQTYDRRLDQTWPGQLVQDAMGAVLAPGRALQSTEPITTEQMIKPAMDLAGLVTGGSYAAPAQRGASGAGIRAYHSSPHDFDKFDLAKIGSGEGAQAYGHGLYFAESPAVSGQGGQYWQQFLSKFSGSEKEAAAFLQNNGFDRAEAIARASEWASDARAHATNKPSSLTERGAQHYEDVLRRLESGAPVGPRTYEVNINADPAHMLDWDKPLSKQSEHVRAALPDIVKADEMYRVRYPHSPMADPFGSNIYTQVGATGGLRIPDAKAQAAAALREAGIPGIKYLDEGSRSQTMINAYRNSLANTTGAERQKILDYIKELEAKPTTSNYVVFDPGIIDIMKKYGIAGAAPAGMGALAAQDQYRE